MLASLTGSVTSFIGNHGVYAVFGLMALDAVFPAASELVMVYAGALASGAFASQHVVLFGSQISTPAWAYVAMALSAAYDHDLAYQRRDLERFFGLYRHGPDGIFLKRGKHLRVRLSATAPFVHIAKVVDDRNDRLFFGKAMVYSLAAAPFVRFLGLNGFLVLNVLFTFLGTCMATPTVANCTLAA